MAIIVPSSVPSLAPAIVDAVPERAAIRMGTVVGKTTTHLQVRISGADTSINAAWLMSYRPVFGDVVAVSKQGAVWVVLGSLGSPTEANNALRNYSFEEGAVGAIPPGWGLATVTGSPTLLTTAWNRDDAIDGVQVAALTSTTATTVATEVVSTGLPVREGQQWVAACYFRTWTDFAATSTATIQLRITWYPDLTLSSIILSNSGPTQVVTRGMINWQLLTAQGSLGFNAPSGAGAMRIRAIVTAWNASAGDTIYFDRMIARRL